MTDSDCSGFPPQALEDRGIVELLLTSDNKDGLSKGVVHGGTCTEAVGAGGPRPELDVHASADGLSTGGVALKSVLLPFSWRWAPKLWASECWSVRVRDRLAVASAAPGLISAAHSRDMVLCRLQDIGSVSGTVEVPTWGPEDKACGVP